MSMDENAYVLFWDFRHITDGHDATVVPFPGWQNAQGLLGCKYHEVPAPVLFEADFNVTQHSDYPCNDLQWPLMSPRMLDALCQVGGFPHRLIPARLVDRNAIGSARSRTDHDLRPEVVDDRFAAVQLTEHIDVVDWDRSTFERSRIDPELCYFEKLVLRKPDGGLPPLFRLSANEGMLLVSAAARRALETIGIRGVEFDPLPGAHRGRAAS